MMWKKKGGNSARTPNCWYQTLVAQTVKIAGVSGLGELDKLELELEAEIQREATAPSKELFKQIRRKGADLLHSKPVLLTVVILNIIDCLLVLSELTVDFTYMSHLLQEHDDVTSKFLSDIENLYPRDLKGISNAHIEHVYNIILQADIHWNGSDVIHTEPCNVTSDSRQVNTSLAFYRTMEAEMEEEHHIVEKIGHGLHFTSVSILAVLVLLTILKVLATVPNFFKSKLQVFDAFVIITSFIVDLVFIEGIMGLEIDKLVVILTFLLPWRIIRVLNSLAVAVIDKERFRLKLLYIQKKKVERGLSEMKKKNSTAERQLEALRKLCRSRGIEECEIQHAASQSATSSPTINALGSFAFRTADALMRLRRQSISSPNLQMISEVDNEADKKNVEDEAESVCSPN